MFQSQPANDTPAVRDLAPTDSANSALAPAAEGGVESAPESGPGIDDIFDIEPPVEVPWWEPWMIYTAVPVASILVLVILYFLTRAIIRVSRKSKFQIAREEALEELTQLERDVIKMNGHEFGIAASDVLRKYLTRARGLRATNQTSFEFLQDLKEHPRFGTAIKSFLAQFLGRCDELKFAPNSSSMEPSLELLAGASDFIRSDIGDS